MFLRRVGVRPWSKNGEVEFGDRGSGWRFVVRYSGYDYVTVVVMRVLTLGNGLSVDDVSRIRSLAEELFDSHRFESRVSVVLNVYSWFDRPVFLCTAMLFVPVAGFCHAYARDVGGVVSAIREVEREALLRSV